MTNCPVGIAVRGKVEMDATSKGARRKQASVCERGLSAS